MKKKLLTLVIASFIIPSLTKAQSGDYYSQGHFQVNDALEVSPGEIWLAADTEIIHYTQNGNQNASYLISNIQSSSTSVNLIRKHNDTIYAALDDGIFKFDGTNWLQVLPPNSLSNIEDMEFTSNGSIWILSGGYVYEYDGTSVIDHVQRGRCMFVYQNDVYVGTFSSNHPGVIYSNSTWTNIPLNSGSNSFKKNKTISLIVDGNGVLWVRHLDGVSKFENQVWTDVVDLSSNFGSLVSSGSNIYFDGGTGQFSSTTNNIFRINSNGTVDSLLTPIYTEDIYYSSMNVGLNGSILLGTSNFLFRFFPTLGGTNIYSELTLNQISAGVASTGDLFRDYNNEENYTGLKAEGKISTFASNLWISGETAGGTVYAAANTYNQRGRDFFSGPVSQEYDSLYVSKYDRVWKITADQIQTHLQNFRNQNFAPIDAILDWPSNGNVANGESKFLAPFMDYNSNGIYEPYRGEHPDIRGDEAIYFMSNDVRGPKTSTYSESMGLEIHGMMYAFDSANIPELYNSIFFSYKVINKSSNNYQNVKLGLWIDVDLGNASDDLLGCDSISGSFYGYNADNDDSGPSGYGLNPPAFGGVFLSDSLSGFMNYNNGGSPGSPIATTDPLSYFEFANLLNSKWKDNTPLKLETPRGLYDINGTNGDGYEISGTSPITKFAYNDAANWYNSPINFSDKRALPIISIGGLDAGEKRCVDIAMIYARDSSNATLGAYTSVVKLKEYVDSIKQFYINEGYKCMGESIGIEENFVSQNRAEFYPNPIERGGVLSIQHNTEVEEVKLVDAQGKLLLSQETNRKKDFTVNIPTHISKGLYFVLIQETSKKVSTLKLSVK